MEFDHPGIEESKSSTEQTYDVVFQDCPLGLELDEQFGLARAKDAPRMRLETDHDCPREAV